MFSEFSNQVWTPSDASVVVANNTDFSVDGSSKKITWTDAENEYVTISFDSIDLSSYEEVSIYFALKNLLAYDTVFTLTVNSTDYGFTLSDFRPNMWNHFLIDCSSWSSISSIVITSNVEDLVLFVDYLGYRKSGYDSDTDLVLALKNHINLDYNVSTALTASAPIGSASLSLASMAYINDSSILELDDGNGVTEEVELIDTDGAIKEAITNAFSSGDTVRAICPVKGESHDSVEPDPVCGIHVFDMVPEKKKTVIKMKSGGKTKEYLGPLGVLIYIDCNSKKKLLQLAREFDRKYGKDFQFLLDGEQVDVYLETSIFTDRMLGNNPRMSYYYNIEPQPYTYAVPIPIETITITAESVDPAEVS